MKIRFYQIVSRGEETLIAPESHNRVDTMAAAWAIRNLENTQLNFHFSVFLWKISPTSLESLSCVVRNDDQNHNNIH